MTVHAYILSVAIVATVAPPALVAAAQSPSTGEATPPPAAAAGQENLFWLSIMNSPRPADFEAYLKQFPNGVFRRLAQNRLDALNTSLGTRVAALPPPRVFTRDDYPPFVFDADDYVLFPDGDRVFVGDQALVMEAQVAPDIRLFSNMHAATEDIFALQERDECPDDGKPLEERRCFKRHWGRSVFGTIMIRLRMFNQDSNPVKTPAFMPKVTFQFAGFKSLLDPHARPIDPVPSTVSVTAVNAVVGHHSNGQDGCVFALNSNDTCNSDIRAGRAVNTEDGSFSTNYVRLGGYFGRMTIGDVDFVVTEQKGFGIALEYHPCGCGGGGWLKEPIRSLYGETHLTLTADYAKAELWRFYRFELRFQYNYAVACQDCVLRHGANAELFGQLRSWNGVGYYLRYDYGRDYYNIAFEREFRHRVGTGLAFNVGKFLRFPFVIPAVD